MMDTVPAASSGSNSLASLLAVPRTSGRGGGTEWLPRIREQARELFLAHGLPTRMDENWRYTDLKRLRAGDFRPVTEREAAQQVSLPMTLVPSGVTPLRLVFVNGAFRADLSQIDHAVAGVSVCSLAAAIDQGQLTKVIAHNLDTVEPLTALPMVALNTALFDDGLVIVVEPRALDTAWVEAVFIGGGETSVGYAPRHCISVGAGSGLILTEQHVSIAGTAYFANPFLQVELQPGASLCHYRTVDCSASANNTITTAVSVGSDARYENFSLIGGGFNRVETQVALGGAGASCTVGAAYHAAGDDLCDNTTLVEHLAPKTTSRQVFRGVIDDAAHAVFQGRVLVARGADEADGHQLSKALLLSDEAEIDQKPALEIFADNVKCSHGAAAGSLDKSALFYLRSRGLPESVARRLLIDSFLAEALQEVSIDHVRGAFQERAAVAQTSRRSHL